MPQTHIINLLEEKPLNSLSEAEVATVDAHIAQCPECRRACDAARVSSVLIVARASETTEVGPFFKTRVMAALRERHLSPEVPALVRMWRAAGALASMLAALLVILVALTVFESRMQSSAVGLSQNIYSPEYVVFEQGDLDDDNLAYDELIATIYEPEDEDGQ
jgi:predicted anti-sigma-YlaC factor YlaD